MIYTPPSNQHERFFCDGFVRQHLDKDVSLRPDNPPGVGWDPNANTQTQTGACFLECFSPTLRSFSSTSPRAEELPLLGFCCLIPRSNMYFMPKVRSFSTSGGSKVFQHFDSKRRTSCSAIHLQSKCEVQHATDLNLCSMNYSCRAS